MMKKKQPEYECRIVPPKPYILKTQTATISIPTPLMEVEAFDEKGVWGRFIGVKGDPQSFVSSDGSSSSASPDSSQPTSTTKD